LSPRSPSSRRTSRGVVTLAVDSAGVRGNQLILYQDISAKPTGTTSTLAGGSAVTGVGNVTGKFFSSGAAVEDLTNILAITYAQLYDRVVPAQNDATSLAAWAAHIVAKAAPMEGRREHAITSTNGTSGAAISLAQSTLNQARFQLAWLFEGETPPAQVASAIGAVRAAIENVSPNENYDDVTLAIAPQRFAAQVATLATQQSCLDAGVTPLRTNTDATVAIVRAITTHSLDGSTPDYRTLDVGQAVTPDYVVRDLALDWTTNRKKVLKYVRPEPGENEPSVQAAVETPSTAAAWAAGRLRKHASPDKGFIIQVDENMPKAEYDFTSAASFSTCP
jgi:phage tail sheath gpL-like